MRICQLSSSPEADPAKNTDGDGGTYMGISLTDAPVNVRRYGPRTWGVYFGDRFYLKDALAVRQFFEQFQDELRRTMSKRATLPLASDPQAGYVRDKQKAS